MEQFVLQLGYLLHLLVLLYLHLQQLYCEALVGPSRGHLAAVLVVVAVFAGLGLKLVDALLGLFFLVDLFGGEDVEDRPGDMLFVEVYFIGLSALLAESCRRIVDDLNNCIDLCILVLECLELLVELDEL